MLGLWRGRLDVAHYKQDHIADNFGPYHRIEKRRGVVSREAVTSGRIEFASPRSKPAFNINPYEANPAKIPTNDRYSDIPLYGRYLPASDDFQPDPKHTNSVSEDSLKYWASVLDLCNTSNRIYEGLEGARDVFALGSVIIKSSHLHARLQGRRASRDFSYADANEVKATALARSVLKDVKIPIVYFASKINGRDVLVQERIAGVGLNIAWQYIPAAQKQLFKEEARDILRSMSKVKTPSSSTTRSYIVEDADPQAHRGIQELEYDIIFGEDNRDPDHSFMHNDFTLSNCIVNNDKIVGLVDWEMAGYFGWKTAAQVHVKIRTPRRENFAALNLSEDVLSDILFWNDLYEV
ncbi:hypothetical protein C2857_004216 [Epichloe festucae Fl1]|uniref:Aminoglycoside phosphotransferase domain-containing protein n=1 Tax=Epichloe festucae (strain Fl1) TaxID=877507 RepID=A0A7S9KKK9_EPIFF|nr:hypothetical protein C2857_004216 [Epichloe festucae Fl1]